MRLSARCRNMNTASPLPFSGKSAFKRLEVSEKNQSVESLKPPALKWTAKEELIFLFYTTLISLSHRSAAEASNEELTT